MEDKNDFYVQVVEFGEDEKSTHNKGIVKKVRKQQLILMHNSTNTASKM